MSSLSGAATLVIKIDDPNGQPSGSSFGQPTPAAQTTAAQAHGQPTTVQPSLPSVAAQPPKVTPSLPFPPPPPQTSGQPPAPTPPPPGTPSPASSGGLFPRGYSSNGQLPVQLFPPGFNSSGGIGAAGGPPPGTPTTAWQPGTAPPPVQGGAAAAGGQAAAASGLAALAKAGIAALVVAGAFETLRSAVQAATAYYVAYGQAANRAIVTKDLISKEVEEREADSALLDKIPIIGPLLGELNRTRNAPQRLFVEQGKALDTDAQRLGRYSGPLAQALGQARAARIGSEVAEAGYLGGGLAKLTEERAKSERLQRAIQAADEKGQAKDQLDTLIEQNKKLQGDLNKRLEKLDKNGRELLQAIAKGGPGPLQRLFNQVGMPPPDDPRAIAGDELRKLRDQQLSKPVFGGL